MLILPRKRPIIVERLSFNAVIPEHEMLDLRYAGVNIGAPKSVNPEDFAQSFGFFGSDVSHGNNFYPDLKLDNILPKPEDFVDIPYRFITATNVGAGSWKATDFSKAGVLKASVDKLDGKPMFTDHEQNSDNWAGIVTGTYWEEAQNLSDGTLIPAGISGIARVDFKSRPNLARGILIGAIYSNSVTVDFAWEPSHMFEEMGEFYDKMGSMGSDGKMIRRVATDIRDYYESSFCWIGADPFAKKIVEGKPYKVDKSAIHYSKALPQEKAISFSKVSAGDKDTYEKEKKFFIGVGIDENIISLSLEKTKVTLTPTQKSLTMNKFLLAFIKAFGTQLALSFAADVKDDTFVPTEAQLTELTTAMAKLGMVKPADPKEADNAVIVAFANGLQLVGGTGQLEAFNPLAPKEGVSYALIPTTEATRVYTELGKLPTEAARKENDSMVALGKDFLKFKQDECVRLYKLTVGDKHQQAVEDTIRKADIPALEGFLKQYGENAIQQYSATCTKCNSNENIEMRSTMDVNDDTTAQVSFSNEDLADEMQTNNLYLGAK